MTEHATRRSILQLAALLAVPARSAAAAGGRDDEASLQGLHSDCMRGVNVGGGDARLPAALRRIQPDHAGEPDRIIVARTGGARSVVSPARRSWRRSCRATARSARWRMPKAAGSCAIPCAAC